MNERERIAWSATALAAVVLGTASAAHAQSENYHTPPKLIKQGTAQSAISGPGTVVVQVFVKSDGSFKVVRIIRSTNHGDDSAALQIAGTSTYAPARQGTKKVSEFYDYTLKFTAGSVSLATPGGLEGYEAEIRSGKYSDAKAGLTGFLSSHPDDPKANVLLGVADYFLNDDSGAVAAFNKAGNVAGPFQSVAANAYAKGAEAAIVAKDGATAAADAAKANQLLPGAATLNLLGTAQIEAGDDASAIRSLEQARTLAVNDSKIDVKERATIDANLAAAYVDAGQPDKAAALLPEIGQLDPSNTSASSRLANYYADKAQAAQKAGDSAAAASYFDKAGAVGGPYAATMYTNEAIALMQGSNPDWKAAKAAADKALALKPNDAEPNLVEGVALANVGKRAEAIPYLQKADSLAKAAGDTSVAARAEQFLKQLGAK